MHIFISGGKCVFRGFPVTWQKLQQLFCGAVRLAQLLLLLLLQQQYYTINTLVRVPSDMSHEAVAGRGCST